MYSHIMLSRKKLINFLKQSAEFISESNLFEQSLNLQLSWMIYKAPVFFRCQLLVLVHSAFNIMGSGVNQKPLASEEEYLLSFIIINTLWIIIFPYRFLKKFNNSLILFYLYLMYKILYLCIWMIEFKLQARYNIHCYGNKAWVYHVFTNNVK